LAIDASFSTGNESRLTSRRSIGLPFTSTGYAGGLNGVWVGDDVVEELLISIGIFAAVPLSSLSRILFLSEFSNDQNLVDHLGKIVDTSECWGDERGIQDCGFVINDIGAY